MINHSYVNLLPDGGLNPAYRYTDLSPLEGLAESSTLCQTCGSIGEGIVVDKIYVTAQAKDIRVHELAGLEVSEIATGKKDLANSLDLFG